MAGKEIFGQGNYRYELVEGWEQLPAGWSHGDVASVATDSQDRVYVFNRSEHPCIVYDRDGKFLGSWGEGVFTRPHGITIIDDIAWCADDADHTIRKCTLDGKVLQTLGTLNTPSDTGYVADAPHNLTTIKKGAGPFNRPTRLWVAPGGDLYASDGYGNARIHRFTGEGTLVQSWGEPGDGPGQINLAHSVWVHHDGRVILCDRENDRLQFFSPDGKLLELWGGDKVTRPMDIYIDKDDIMYVAEGAWAKGGTTMAGRPTPETRDAAVSVRDMQGNVLSKWGGPDVYKAGWFAAPHGIWVDSHGDIYVAEVIKTALSRTNQWHPGCHSLQKFARV
jgi:hypothetical protein